MRWWSHPPHQALEQTRDALEERVASTDWRTWAITLRDQHQAVGTVGAHEARPGRVYEIGYSLVPAHWGKGYAAEAVGRLIDHLFDVDGARRVFADTDPDNESSNAMLTKLGFSLEGRLRGQWETHIGVRDSLIWGLLAGEWKHARRFATVPVPPPGSSAQ